VRQRKAQKIGQQKISIDANELSHKKKRAQLNMIERHQKAFFRFCSFLRKMEIL
jgi:phosphopantothenate synthetase